LKVDRSLLSHLRGAFYSDLFASVSCVPLRRSLSSAAASSASCISLVHTKIESMLLSSDRQRSYPSSLRVISLSFRVPLIRLCACDRYLLLVCCAVRVDPSSIRRGRVPGKQRVRRGGMPKHHRLVHLHGEVRQRRALRDLSAGLPVGVAHRHVRR